MSKKIYGIALILVAVFIAFDTFFDLRTREASGRDFFMLAICLFLAIRGVLAFISGKR